MTVFIQIAEARATAVGLRASAQACGPHQDALKARLTSAAEALESMSQLALSLVLHAERTEIQSDAGGQSVSAHEAKAPPQPSEELKTAVWAEIGRLHKTHALMIAVQFAANHECEFDVSDALAAVCDRVEQSIVRLDKAS